MLTRTISRYLDSFEAPYAQNRNAFVTRAVEYRGTVDEEALARAFNLVCARYPVLRGRIRAEDDRWLLYVTSDHCPSLSVTDGDEVALRREAESPLELSQWVTRLKLIRGDGRGYVAWGITHAVTDGHGWWPMWHDLWNLYTDIVKGSDVSVASGESLPSSPSEFLKERWGGFQDESIHASSDTQPPTPQRGALDELDKVTTLDHRLRLTKKDTKALIEAAGIHGTSVHALVCGAILVALRTQSTATEPILLVCGTGVDLRKRVTPPVGSTDVTNFMGMHYANMMVPINANPVAIGRDLKARLDVAISERKIVVAPSNLRHVAAALHEITPPPLAIVQITNPGVMPPLTHPADLEFVDLTNVIPLVELPPPFWWYNCYTYRGRLTILCCGPSISRLGEHIDRLREVIAGCYP